MFKVDVSFAEFLVFLFSAQGLAWGSPKASDIKAQSAAFSAFSCPHSPPFLHFRTVESPQTLVFIG